MPCNMRTAKQKPRQVRCAAGAPLHFLCCCWPAAPHAPLSTRRFPANSPGRLFPLAFAWLVFFPVLKAGKKGLFGALLALSVFILPFLYVLSRLLKSNGNILAAGAPTAALSVVFLWSVFALFKRLKTRKRLAAAASLLLAVPTCLLINLVLSKLFFLPVIDVWDMLAIFLLLISAAALFIADLAAKKKHIVSEKKPEHSGSRGHA